MRLAQYVDMVWDRILGLMPRGHLLRRHRAIVAARQGQTWAWLVAAGTVALIVGGATLGVGLRAVPLASTAETRLEAFRQASQGDLLLDGTSGLDGLRTDVSSVKADLQSVSQLTRWVQRGSMAFSWLPILDREIAASAGQIDRVQNDLDAALTILDSSSALIEISDDAQSAILTPAAAPSTTLLKSRAAELEASFSDSLETLQESKELAGAFGVMVHAPRIRGLTGLLSRLEDRMLSASEVGRQASSLLSELLELADDAQPLIGQFALNGAESEPLTSAALKATLTSVTDQARSARVSAREVAAAAAETGQAGRLVAQLDTLEQLLTVLLTVSNASTVSLSAVEATAESLDGSGGGLLSGGRGLLNIFDAFVEREDEFASAVIELDEAQRILDGLSSNGDGGLAAGGLDDISRLVGDLRSGLELVTRVAPMGREILGGNGLRRYLILGQSADELRATGGFVSSIWLATFDDGALQDIEYQDSIRVDDWDRIELYPKAPPGLEEHMYGWVWLLRDVSWEPNFPTTARSAEDMYQIGQRLNVDGVIAINQWTLLRLIDSVGEITPPGDVPVNSRNLLSVLEEGTDLHGRAYMDLVLQGFIDKLDRPASIPTLVRLASGLHDTLEARDMLLFFDDEGLQSLMGELGWDGRIAQDTRDYLYVVDSNVGWNKVDRNIQREIRYAVDLSRGPRPRVNLTLAYNNHSGPSAPSCDPQWLNRRQDYGSLKNACYWNLVRVYVPQESIMLSSTPMLLPEYSVSVEIGLGRVGEDSGRISSTHNKKVFSGLTAIEAGERSEITLVYDLPSSAVQREGDVLIYELLVQKQPGVRQRRVAVELDLPEGYRLVSSSAPAVQTDESHVSVEFMLTSDFLLRVELTRATNGSG